jgi:hypothetical protein
MDLGTVKTKLQKKQYKSIAEVGADVRLVWTNCMTYNQDGSDFYKLADTLNKRWEEKYKKLLSDLSSTNMTNAAVAGSASAVPEGNTQIKDRQIFARSLYNISKEDLGKVLVELEVKCPSSITRNAQEDEVELNVDKIPAGLLQELTSFVTICASKTKKKKPTKQKSV